MKTEIKELMWPTKEELILLRFAFDDETKKMQIEAMSKKYDAFDELINSESVRLLFRNEKYESAKVFCFSGDIPGKILHMLLRKLEIDRKIESGTLCETLPEGIPPCSEKSNG